MTSYLKPQVGIISCLFLLSFLVYLETHFFHSTKKEGKSCIRSKHPLFLVFECNPWMMHHGLAGNFIFIDSAI